MAIFKWIKKKITFLSFLDEKEIAEKEYDDDDEEEVLDEEANDESKKIFEEIKQSEKINLNQVDEPLKNRINNIAEIRESVGVAQEKGAQKMLACNNKQINTIQVGDIVLFRVLPIDRGPADPKNLLCFVIQKKHDLFQLVSRAGCLIKSQSKETFYLWNTFIKTNLVPQVAPSKIGNKIAFGP